jgi:hypothetical protein
LDPVFAIPIRKASPRRGFLFFASLKEKPLNARSLKVRGPEGHPDVISNIAM